MSDERPVIPLAYQRQDAAAALGIGVDTFDRHVRRYVKCVYVGSTRVWPVAELERFLAAGGAAPVISSQKSKRPRAASTAGGMVHEEPAP